MISGTCPRRTLLPEFPARGLLQALAQLCIVRGYARFEWWVLDWNTPPSASTAPSAHSRQEDWTTFRIDGDALRALGRDGP